MSGIVEALAAPLRALLDAFGTGDLTSAGVDAAIRAVETELARIGSQTAGTNVAVGQAWTGVDAAAAQRSIGSGGIAAGALSQHTGALRESVTVAAETVHKGHAELTSILDSFVGKAEAANPTLLDPGGLIAVLSLAAEHLQRALDVLCRVRGELDGESGKVSGLAAGTPQSPGTVDGGAATTPASTSASTLPTGTAPGGSGAGTGGGAGGGSGGGGSALGGLASTLGSGARSGSAKSTAGRTRSGASPAGATGRGTGATVTADGTGGYQVRLPDGTVVRAPNAKAAAAVQAGLTQLGVPYSWGGTTPGVGLDCSGFTQWAYRQAGIELPRLANEQDVGVQVSASQLQPGDLAVWEGHVAMVIGDGRMVEAGDPVQISAIRTDNIGQAFYGFWRPTG
ncbi:C40 family peptidase [Tsukamurella serpentis]